MPTTATGQPRFDRFEALLFPISKGFRDHFENHAEFKLDPRLFEAAVALHEAGTPFTSILTHTPKRSCDGCWLGDFLLKLSLLARGINVPLHAGQGTISQGRWLSELARIDPPAFQNFKNELIAMINNVENGFLTAGQSLDTLVDARGNRVIDRVFALLAPSSPNQIPDIEGFIALLEETGWTFRTTSS